MDSTGLGQAMGEHYREEMAKRALKETEELRGRVFALERTLAAVIKAFAVSGRPIAEDGERQDSSASNERPKGT